MWRRVKVNCWCYLDVCLRLVTDWLTNSMGHSPSWEANRSSASQEITIIVRHPKVLCHIHKRPPSVPIPSRFNSVNAYSFHFLNILILSSYLRVSYLFILGLPTKSEFASLLSPPTRALEGLTTKTLNPKSRSSDWYLNRGPPNYKKGYYPLYKNVDCYCIIRN
jgi:hypothetical protein